MTISIGLFAGMQPKWAAEYCYFLAITTILGASILQTTDVIWFGGLKLTITVLVTASMVSAIVEIYTLKIEIHLL